MTENKPENLFWNIGCNIIIPALILSKFSNDAWLGNKLGLIVALAFPLGYGLADFAKREKINVFSVIGLISVMLTGGISLMELDPAYLAIKEAAVPAVLGLFVLCSTWFGYPVIEKIFLNDMIFDMEKINQQVSSNNAQRQLDRALANCSYLIVLSFVFSSVLNYILATNIVVSMPGTDAYNEELGKLTLYSYPVIALPCSLVMGAALFYLVKQLRTITQLDFEDLLSEQMQEKASTGE